MTHTISHISVIGNIWMPNAVCAMDYTLSPFDVEQMADGALPTRGDVEQWINSHCGDFQSIEDFAATIGYNGLTCEFPWSNEESEATYADCMWGDED